MNWIFWQNIVSPHLSPLARALATIPEQTVTVVAEDKLSEGRKAAGWSTPSCFPAQVLIRPTEADIERLVRGDQRERHHADRSIHLLNGLPDVALNRRVLARLAKTESMVGLISERPDNRGMLGLMRRAKYRFDRHRFGPRLHFILAMGRSGVEWFESAGYEPSKIFPFAYMTERPTWVSKASDKDGDLERFRILYLGQILPRKDGVTAIRALDRIPVGNWRFNVIGNGPDLERWKRVAAESRVAERICFRPAVPNRKIGDLLRYTDLLLLPSRNDGWGAVVNEALMSGVPVVCSDNCGAADLLRAPWRGSTFQAGSAKSLHSVLQGWLEAGKQTEETRARIREWSSALDGSQVAQYLIGIVAYLQSRGLRPKPPWY